MGYLDYDIPAEATDPYLDGWSEMGSSLGSPVTPDDGSSS